MATSTIDQWLLNNETDWYDESMSAVDYITPQCKTQTIADIIDIIGSLCELETGPEPDPMDID